MKTTKASIPNRRVKFLLIMASLVLIERGFMISGIQAVPEQYLPLKLKKYQSIIHRVHLTFGFVSYSSWLCSMACFVLFQAKTFADYTKGSTFLITGIVILIFYASFAWQSTKVSKALTDLKSTVEQRNRNVAVRSIYLEKDQMFKKLSDTIWKVSFILVQLIVFPVALVSFYRYHISDSSVDSFQLPVPCIFLWNWQSPIGYLAAICVQCYWLNFAALLCVGFLLSFTVFCLFLKAFALDIKQCTADLNASAVSVDRKLTAADRLELKQRLSDIIQFHSYAKEFVERFSELIGLTLTFVIVLSSTVLCALLLCVDKAVEYPIEMYRMGTCFVLFLACDALYCCFGQQVTTRFEEINDAIYNCSWERFPLEAQKLLPTMMIVCQKPVYIHGYLNLRCTHEYFKKIINGTYSFFMVLRDFNH